MSSRSRTSRPWHVVVPKVSSTLHILFAICFIAVAFLGSSAEAETRKLKLYFLHTGEKATITYKKNSTYVKSGLKRINYFLRDWRRNEPTRMDPNLLDLVWEVYRQSGSKDYIHVISAYRSPATNSMLRKRGRGVAKKSQHTYGKALDFFLPDVKLSKLRKIGLIKQVGGVGYYPRSGSPFVHMDTGRVRHWPRMSRKELVRVFPNGKTLHVPSDGKPLKGYNQAVAAYNARKSSKTKLAKVKGNEKERRSFFARLAALGNDEDDDVSSNVTPAPRRVKTQTQKENVVKQENRDVNGPVLEEKKELERPELPQLADIPVPQLAPRAFARDNTVKNIIEVASLDNQTNLRRIGKSDRLNVRANPTVTPQQVVVNNNRFNANNTPGNRQQLATINNNDLRNQLIAQATKQLRVQQLAPLRPGVEVGSKFETALVSPTVNPRNNNPVLTRSFSSSNRLVDDINNDIATDKRVPEIVPTQRRIDILAGQQDIAKAKSIQQNRQVEKVQQASLSSARASDDKDLRSLEHLRQTIENENKSLYDDNRKSNNTIASLIDAAVPERAPRRDTLSVGHIPPTPSTLNRSFSQDPIRVSSLGITEVIKTNGVIRTASNPLDHLKIGWYEENTTKKHVFSNKLTLNAADSIRAPAYGKATIRQMPKAVLTAGFNRTSRVQNFSRFSGNAISAQSFTKLN